jgi:peptidyl-prolyl cis-trans isomerase B (cyclophilin B)
MRYLFTSLLIATSMSSAYAANTTSAKLPSIIEMQTNVGTITMQLDWNNAPKSSENFLNYTNKGFYKNTIFHNIVKNGGGYIQGGVIDAQTSQPKTTLDKKPLVPISNELNQPYYHLKNKANTVAMMYPKGLPDSVTSQFFFNVTSNNGFDKTSNSTNGYTVFANIISGIDVVNKISQYQIIPISLIPTAVNIMDTPYTSIDTPYINKAIDCGFSFCLKKVIIENMYTSEVVDNINSITRVTVNGTGGSLTSSPAGINCKSTMKAGSKTCVLHQSLDTPVTLKATTSKGYEFRGWSGDCQGLGTPLTLITSITDTTTKATTPKNNNCTATFAKIGS